jgi:hypothetical protein
MGFARPEAFTAAVFGGGHWQPGGVVAAASCWADRRPLARGYIGPLTGGVPVSIPIFCLYRADFVLTPGLPACARNRGGPA